MAGSNPCHVFGGVDLVHLRAIGVSKNFGGVRALRNVDFSCQRGEIHALLGANGSGKSTLSKIITGVVAADRGALYINDEAAVIEGPKDMFAHGISAVYQELSLIPQLTVAENIMLGHEPSGICGIRNMEIWKTASKVLQTISSRLENDIPLHVPVKTLSTAEQQLVEIAKALSREPQILILDEATASLRESEVKVVFEHVRRLRDQGSTVIFISHRLEEVFELCDRATVLRNGQVVATVELAETTEQDLLNHMLGEVASVDSLSISRPDCEVRLGVQGLSSGQRFQDISFEVKTGEVLGLGGLQGQGQSELIQALYGARAYTGKVFLGKREVKINNPAKAIELGIVLVPGNRNVEGLALQRSILENITLPSIARRSWWGVLNQSNEGKVTDHVIKRLQIKVADPQFPVNTLSGGNQQKVVIGKWLLTEPQVMLLDDPTKGVDVQARVEIYHAIEELCSQGVSVVISSSDNKELLALCHRVLVMYEGRIVAELADGDLTEENLVAAALRITEPEAGEEEVSGIAR